MALYKCKFPCKHNGTPYKAGETKEFSEDPGRFFELVTVDSGTGEGGNTDGRTGAGGNDDGLQRLTATEVFVKKMKDAYNHDPLAELAKTAGVEDATGSKAELAVAIYSAIIADATCLEKLPEDVQGFYAEVQEA